MSDQQETSTPRSTPSILMGGGHLAALWALAVIQPLLSLLGSNPDFFVARDNTGFQIVVFVLLVTFLPPLVATLVEALVDLVSKKARWFLHLGLIGLLFSVLVLQFLKQFADGPALPMIVVAIAAGIGLAWAYGYRKFLRSLTDILIPAPLIILAVFFFFSEASELTISSREPDPIEVSIGNPAPVVMLVFDEFPVGSLMTPDLEINPKRYPNFAELEKSSNWYRNTVTDASYTAIAVPSILTGKSADRDSLPTAPDHPESIFTLLGGSYRVRAVEPITQLCPEGICGNKDEAAVGTVDAVTGLFDDLRHVQAHLILPESMSSSLPDISQSFEGFGGNPVESIERGRARQWVRDKLDASSSWEDGEDSINHMLEARKPAAERTFDFAHVEEPHYPWTHYPDGLRYSERTEDFRAFITDTDWLAEGYLTDRARQGHLLEVGFADHLLGRVMDRIKADGLWEETMVVVVADHGGAMTTGSNRREAAPETMGEIAMVPLFVKAPGQTSGEGKVIDETTCITEIVPMMAENLGIDMPWKSPDCDQDEVTIENGTGPVITSPVDTVLEQRSEYIDTLASLFGGETGWPSVLKLGPNQDLIGTPLSSLDVSAAGPGVSASPDVTGALATDLQPKVPLNPVLRQRGQLKGISEDTPMAVAVNGEIAAVGRAYEDSSRILYSILLPRASLNEGRNQIQVFTVDTADASPSLTELWSSDNQ